MAGFSPAASRNKDPWRCRPQMNAVLLLQSNSFAGKSLVPQAAGFKSGFRSPGQKSGDVVQLVRTLPCHGRGRGFESRRPRHSFKRVRQLLGIGATMARGLRANVRAEGNKGIHWPSCALAFVQNGCKETPQSAHLNARDFTARCHFLQGFRMNLEEGGIVAQLHAPSRVTSFRACNADVLSDCLS